MQLNNASARRGGAADDRDADAEHSGELEEKELFEGCLIFNN
jgi:hypothetical protein